MGCKLDWEALPIIVEMFGVQDVEMYVREIAVIREYQNRENR